jgi:hypothetical protein
MAHSESPSFLFFSHASLVTVRVLKEDDTAYGSVRSLM